MQRLQPELAEGLNTAILHPPKIVHNKASLLGNCFNLNTSSASDEMGSKKAAHNPDVRLKDRDVDVRIKVCPLFDDRVDAAKL